MRHAPCTMAPTCGAWYPTCTATKRNSKSVRGGKQSRVQSRKPPASLRVHSHSSSSNAASQQRAMGCNNRDIVAPACRRGLLQHLRERNCLARLTTPQPSRAAARSTPARGPSSRPAVVALHWVGSSRASSMLATWARGWLLPSATTRFSAARSYRLGQHGVPKAKVSLWGEEIKSKKCAGEREQSRGAHQESKTCNCL